MKLKILFLVVAMALISVSVHGDQNSSLTAAIAFLIERDPGHPRKGNIEFAKEIAQAIDTAAVQYGENQWILTSMASWESHFRPDVLSLKKKGPAGEKGLLQCGRHCAAQCPHFMDTVKGQALCGAFWLDISNKTCQSDDKAALTYYASGEVCEWKKYKPKHCRENNTNPENIEACYHKAQMNLRAKTRRRINRANKLKNEFASH